MEVCGGARLVPSERKWASQAWLHMLDGSKCARVDDRSQMIDFEDGDDGCRSCF